MNIKGQGALEYLLLIGGAVLVAAIVIALVTGIPGGTPNPENDTFCSAKFNFGECDEVPGITVVTVGGYTGVGVCCGYATDGTDASSNADFGYCKWKAVDAAAGVC